MHDRSLTVRVITLRTTWTSNTKYFKSFIGIIGIGMWPCMCGLTQSHAILCDPMDCSLPSSSVCGIFQARILEWVAISSSRRSSQPRDWTHVSCILAGRFFTTEPPGKYLCDLSSVQLLSCVWLFATPWTVTCQAPLSVGILQARILEWVAISSPRRSSLPRDWTHVSCGSFVYRQILYHLSPRGNLIVQNSVNIYWVSTMCQAPCKALFFRI